MHPILIQLGPLTIHSYGVMLALGAGVGFLVLGWLARRADMDPDQATSLALWVLIAGLVGSRIVFVALEPWAVFANQPWRVLFIWEGGLVFYGGVALALPVGLWLAHHWRLPLLNLMDCFAPALAIGQFFGRLGCFSAGCCYGAPWEGWCAVTFTDPHTLAPPGVPLHPAQLYSAAELLLIFAVLLFIWRRRAFVGQIFFTYGLMHGLGRFVIEQFRSDYRGEPIIWGLTPTAVFAISFALISAVMLIILYRRRGSRAGG